MKIYVIHPKETTRSPESPPAPGASRAPGCSHETLPD